LWYFLSLKAKSTDIFVLLFHPKVNQLNSLTHFFSGFDRQYGLPEQRDYAILTDSGGANAFGTVSENLSRLVFCLVVGVLKLVRLFVAGTTFSA
jgi:hypothetical protein